MIRVRQIKVDIEKEDELAKKVSSKLKIGIQDIIDMKINKKSIDARKGLNYVYEVDVLVRNENKILLKNKMQDVLKTPDEKYKFEITGEKKLENKIIIVGSGPAGLFAAYTLAENGYRPLIIERGEKIEDRVKSVEEFWNNSKLNINSNVQFGEGGAGTFSDGKLNTLTKDKKFRMKKVFETFVLSGAPKEILYENKPHIGTNLLRNVIVNMRKKIEKMGGEFRYNTCLTNLNIKDGKIKGIEINGTENIPCEVLILAIGHSARDTFSMLYENKLQMEAKPFAIGVRIEHPQEMISKNQYGNDYYKLKPASYKLVTNINGRGVYSFCMCPGGYVVNASSEEGGLAINGMSNHERESINANSAIVVTVSPLDFGNHPLDGIYYQKKLEEKAYKIGSGKIPIQLFEDFENKKISNDFKEVKPVFKGDYVFADLNEIFPEYINDSLKKAIHEFDKKIHGFARKDAILASIESRTSSPVRIIRNENFISNIDGIYPCGEGAGYAGGITTSAIDGIKVAEEIAKIYMNER